MYTNSDDDEMYTNSDDDENTNSDDDTNQYIDLYDDIPNQINQILAYLGVQDKELEDLGEVEKMQKIEEMVGLDSTPYRLKLIEETVKETASKFRYSGNRYSRDLQILVEKNLVTNR